MNTYNQTIDSLNFIDSMIEHSNLTLDEQKQIAKAYNLVFTFIEKHNPSQCKHDYFISPRSRFKKCRICGEVKKDL